MENSTILITFVDHHRE